MQLTSWRFLQLQTAQSRRQRLSSAWTGSVPASAKSCPVQTQCLGQCGSSRPCGCPTKCFERVDHLCEKIIQSHWWAWWLISTLEADSSNPVIRIFYVLSIEMTKIEKGSWMTQCLEKSRSYKTFGNFYLIQECIRSWRTWPRFLHRPIFSRCRGQPRESSRKRSISLPAWICRTSRERL